MLGPRLQKVALTWEVKGEVPQVLSASRRRKHIEQHPHKLYVT